MILDLTLKQDEKTKKILAEEAPWNPSQAVKDRTAQVMYEFLLADTIRNKPYAEFNFQSLLQRIALDQMSYNQYPGDASADPLQAWKSLAFRPIVRNKIISIAAHIVQATIYPTVYAQNEQDEDDRDAATVMRDLIEYATDQSEYEKTFLYSVISALVNPATFIHKEYRETYRDIKEIQADGTWKQKRILDEKESGFKDTLVPPDELWIGNIYVHDIQKQPYLIWRRVIDYSMAREKYRDNENFKFVKPGLQFLYSNVYNLFYQMYDEAIRGHLVEEVIYFNRLADLELRFVNGILMDDPDRPIQRKDKNYPFVKGGYELFDDGRFFYYKSLAFKLANDENVVNTAYRMVIDGTYLQIMPPAVVFGSETIGSSVIAPGAITTIDNAENPNASFQTIQTNNNLSAGLNLLQKVEDSISESSTDINEQPERAETAFQASLVQQNARTLLGIFGKMIAFMVKDYGDLLMSDIIQHLTVGEATDVLAPGEMLKFRKFLLPEKVVDGKTKTRKIEFDAELPDQVAAPAENQIISPDVMEISRTIQKKEKSLKNSMQIYKVNPTLFRKLKFKCVVKPEAVMPKNDAFIKAAKLEEYDRAIQNPLTNMEAVTRDLLFGSYDHTKDDPDKYMKTQEQMQPQQNPMQQNPMQQKQPGRPQDITAEAGPLPKSLSSIAKAM